MYDSSLKYKWDNKNVLDYALKEGLEKGLEMGIEQGIEKGKHQEAIAIAREMKKDGLPINEIQKFTRLSADEIEKL